MTHATTDPSHPKITHPKRLAPPLPLRVLYNGFDINSTRPFVALATRLLLCWAQLQQLASERDAHAANLANLQQHVATSAASSSMVEIERATLQNAVDDLKAQNAKLQKKVDKNKSLKADVKEEILGLEQDLEDACVRWLVS